MKGSPALTTFCLTLCPLHIQGFLLKCRLNTKLFDREKVETIFSNLESLYQFQVSFLQQLKVRVDPDHMEESQIGQVFVNCVSLVVVHVYGCICTFM